ncbi:MAG: hypothetical protein L6V87_08145 [Ruminococcus sp.]|nr:MAG: hypothetical protein L6V87_08145 [Ruminococcus sp.]
MAVEAYLDDAVSIYPNFACKGEVFGEIIVARSKSAACECAVKSVAIGNAVADVGNYDLVRVIAVARSCYDISVSDEIVIGLGFEITALMNLSSTVPLATVPPKYPPVITP